MSQISVPDTAVQEIQSLFEKYRKDHPTAQVSVYRYNSASIRIRIIDPAFAEQSAIEREEGVWKWIDKLSDEAASDITLLVLVTPNEAPNSLANIEFENPSPTIP